MPKINSSENQRLIDKLNEALGILNKFEYSKLSSREFVKRYPTEAQYNEAMRKVREVREALS